jgi:hypothetical protein
VRRAAVLLPPAVVVALAILAINTGLALAIARPDPAAAASPARLLVAGNEWRLTLSRKSVVPGRAIIQLQNRGEDDHDLRLQRITRRPDAPVARWAVTPPGGLTELSVRVSRGRYRLWCSLPGHRELGMRATLRVSRRR